jgi:lysophospholipase L1-like esterase
MKIGRRWRLRLLSLLFGLLCAGVLSEVSLRLAGIGYPPLYQPDMHCGSRLRPGVRGVWIEEGFGHISINSLGFRGPEFQANKPLGTQRICVLGDSFIEALQVDYSASLCGQLQQQLSSQLSPPFTDCEVINAGVSGYGTAQQLLMLEHYVLPLSPDVVLLACYPENDIRNNHPLLEVDPRIPYYAIEPDGSLVLNSGFRKSEPYLLASSSYERFKAAWVNRSRVLQLLRHLRSRAQAGPQVESTQTIEGRLVAAATEASYIYRDTETDIEQQAWEVTQRLIEQMATTCRERKIRFIVFSVSTSLQVYPDQNVRQRIAEQCGIGDLFYAEHVLQTFCGERDIEFIPLASAMQQVADRSGEYLHGFSNSQLGLGHWSIAGNQAACQIITQYDLVSKLHQATEDQAELGN